MKKILLILTIAYQSILLTAQKAYEINPIKCGHVNSFEKTSPSSAQMDKYDVKFYHLDIEATNESTEVKGNTLILATTKNESLSEFVVELNTGIIVSKILINNHEYSFLHQNNEVTVSLETPISSNTDFTAQIFYFRPGTLNTDGIYNTLTNNNIPVTFTLSESFHARNWFSCKQDLHDKADSVFVFVTVNKGLKVGSNGLLTKITDMGNNKVRYEWKSFYPIDFYLISMAVANYKEDIAYSKPTALNGDSILIQNYFYDAFDFEQKQAAFSATGKMIEVFSDLYSLYPFWKEKYGHCYVPLGGAMEHQTMTSTGVDIEYVTAHELGHQWFGDNVTCATWQDIWINEGFASYSEYLWFEAVNQTEAKNTLENAQAYALTSPTGSIYVPFEDAQNEERIFSWYLTYRKGLCFVHMIRTEINNDYLFFSALKEFQIEFSDSVASGDDFMTFTSEFTGTDLTHLFAEWYYGEGYPTYKAIWNQNDNKLNLTISQTTTGATPYFTNTIEFKIKLQNGDTTIYLKPESAEETFSLDFTQPILKIEMDPDNNILKSYASTITSLKEERKILEITCYPNPIENDITINNPNRENIRIEIYNLQGKLVGNYTVNEIISTINTSNWPSGAYALVINTKNSSVVKKMIK